MPINTLKEKLRPRASVQYWLRHRKLQTYALAGATGSILNVALLFALTEFVRLHYLFSAVIALEASMLWNFVMHDRFTWRHATKSKPPLQRLAHFHAVSFVGVLIYYGTLFALTEFWHVYYLLSSIAGILVAVAWNYKVNDRFTFQ